MLQPVASVDVHRERDRPERMHAVAHSRVVSKRLERREYPVGVLEALATQIAREVQVAALTMHELAEDARMRRVYHRHRVLVVAAVGERHAVAAVLLGGFHDRPGVVDPAHARHLHHRVYSALHGIARDHAVRLPVRVDVHEVAHAGFAQLLVRLGANKELRLPETILLQRLLMVLRLVLVEFAERHHLHAGHVAKTMHSTAAASARADHRHADLLELRRRESHEGRLTLHGRGLRRRAASDCRHGNGPCRAFKKRAPTYVLTFTAAHRYRLSFISLGARASWRASDCARPRVRLPSQ